MGETRRLMKCSRLFCTYNGRYPISWCWSRIVVGKTLVPVLTDPLVWGGGYQDQPTPLARRDWKEEIEGKRVSLGIRLCLEPGGCRLSVMHVNVAKEARERGAAQKGLMAGIAPAQAGRYLSALRFFCLHAAAKGQEECGREGRPDG